MHVEDCWRVLVALTFGCRLSYSYGLPEIVNIISQVRYC